MIDMIKIEHLPEVAKKLMDKARRLKSEQATVIALSGELGAGKTTLTQQIAKILGIRENLISPTFVIMKRYEIAGDFKNLIHIDAYRLKGKDELWKLGWQEMIEDKNNLIIIEWPENVEGLIPDDAIKVMLSHADDTTRTIDYK